MMDPALLDTDILIDLLKQRDRKVVEHATNYFAQHQHFAFSAITRYEILRGLKEKNAVVQSKRFATFVQKSIVVAVTDREFDLAADLWVMARSSGRSAGDADLIIAASAIVNQRVLVTGNQSHFDWIPNLQLGNWRR